MNPERHKPLSFFEKSRQSLKHTTKVQSNSLPQPAVSEHAGALKGRSLECSHRIAAPLANLGWAASLAAALMAANNSAAGELRHGFDVAVRAVEAVWTGSAGWVVRVVPVSDQVSVGRWMVGGIAVGGGG